MIESHQIQKTSMTIFHFNAEPGSAKQGDPWLGRAGRGKALPSNALQGEVLNGKAGRGGARLG